MKGSKAPRITQGSIKKEKYNLDNQGEKDSQERTFRSKLEEECQY
jgi:hypothetical protein